MATNATVRKDGQEKIVTVLFSSLLIFFSLEITCSIVAQNSVVCLYTGPVCIIHFVLLIINNV